MYKRNVEMGDPEGKPGMCRKETVNVEEVQKWGMEQIEYTSDFARYETVGGEKRSDSVAF